MKQHTKAHFAVLATNLFFAANFSLIKMISPSLIKPFGLNIFRLAASLILFWLMWLFSKDKAGIKKEDTGRFILCALTGVAINQMLFLKGLTLTSSIHASLLMLTTPLLITVFAWFVLKEAFTVYKIAGLITGIAGAIILISGRESNVHATDHLTGDLLIMVNAISYSIFFILVKPLMTRYTPVEVIRWVFTIGFIMILPFGWSQAVATDLSRFTINDLLALASIAVTGTFLAYYFNAYGIRHLGAGITGAYIYTQPVFAVLIATFVLGETLSLQKVLAAVLIFGGVFLVGKKNLSAEKRLQEQAR
jgi:drug/metabolite transporter (DMT)-like permease